MDRLIAIITALNGVWEEPEEFMISLKYGTEESRDQSEIRIWEAGRIETINCSFDQLQTLYGIINGVRS